jgi:RimJ/RimL family protein N-acetyltransferase
MIIRPANIADAVAMSGVLEELIAAGKRSKPGDEKFALSHYIEHPHRIECAIAMDACGNMLGFQSLKLAHARNTYATPPGWGIIGTHVRPSAARTGIGSQLFTATVAAALGAKLQTIEAYIDSQNSAALKYYDAMGFTTNREPPGAVCKRFNL